MTILRCPPATMLPPQLLISPPPLRPLPPPLARRRLLDAVADHSCSELGDCCVCGVQRFERCFALLLRSLSPSALRPSSERNLWDPILFLGLSSALVHNSIVGRCLPLMHPRWRALLFSLAFCFISFALSVHSLSSVCTVSRRRPRLGNRASPRQQAPRAFPSMPLSRCRILPLSRAVPGGWQNFPGG